MYGRLLSLWHVSYEYRGRVACTDEGKKGRLMLIGILQWCDVGDYPQVRGVGRSVQQLLGLQ